MQKYSKKNLIFETTKNQNASKRKTNGKNTIIIMY